MCNWLRKLMLAAYAKVLSQYSIGKYFDVATKFVKTSQGVFSFLFFQWCDCRVLNVIPPTQAEIDKDAELEREEQVGQL